MKKTATENVTRFFLIKLFKSRRVRRGYKYFFLISKSKVRMSLRPTLATVCRQLSWTIYDFYSRVRHLRHRSQRMLITYLLVLSMLTIPEPSQYALRGILNKHEKLVLRLPWSDQNNYSRFLDRQIVIFGLV